MRKIPTAMKQYALIIVLASIIQISSFSQSCLPEGITFSSQQEIDNFQANHPNCTAIEGNVKISGDSIHNLSGLYMLTDIYGSLWIRSNDQLSSLEGLNNLNSIGEYLRIAWNESLTDLDGLENLNFIGDYLCLYGNASLGNLAGLENLTLVGGEIEIVNNSSLISLAGLENIDHLSFTNLYIYLNSSLSSCEVQSICSYLQNPNGIIGIYNNAPGCNNPSEVATACGYTLDCLPFGNYYLFSQDEVDNFDSNYPNCTEINGDVIIEGDDITNLAGLNSITSIEGNLVIGRPLCSGINPLLSDLSGLDNLSIVHGSLIIAHNENMLCISGLGNLDSIGNSLEITSNHELTDIIGLANLLSVAGNIMIGFNDELGSLTGLENISSIGGSLYIDENDFLTDLSGLNNLEFVQGGLSIWGNSHLSSLFGLGNLTKIGGGLSVIGTYELIDLSGLENLDSIGGSLNFEFNNALLNFAGLDNLNFVQGDLYISNNYNLSSLTGLDNIDPESIDQLTIINNFELSSCNISSICNYLSDPGGSINIYNNAPGCDSPPEIADACGITLSCLPFGNYYLRSQSDVDEFFDDYPNCFDLKGYVTISGDNIYNLSELYGLASVEKGLIIKGNYSLIILTGLSSLTSIGGIFQIGHYVGGNPMLQNFTGLEGLTTIGESFEIISNDELLDFSGLSSLRSVGGLSIISNNSLGSLSGLENLDSINGNLDLKGSNVLNDINHLSNLKYIDGQISISNNEALYSLSGLDNIEANSINFLYINNNIELSSCDVNSICEYLADSNSNVVIAFNAPGCNSPEEVELACTTAVPEIFLQSEIVVYPNPATNQIYFSTPSSTIIEEVNIFNLLGQNILHKTGKTYKIDVSMLRQGMYIIELISRELKYIEKVIIN